MSGIHPPNKNTVPTISECISMIFFWYARTNKNLIFFMTEIISLGTVLLTKINNVSNTYDDIGRTAKALQNLLSLVVEFTKIRVGMSNPLDPELSSQLQDIFTRLDDILIRSSQNATNVSSLLFCLSGMCGPFKGSTKILKDLQNLETELCRKLELIKIDLLSNNSELMSMIAGLYYDRPDTPQIYWHRMFRERQWVKTEEFADAICSTTGCYSDVAAYISATLSDKGLVRATNFFSSFQPDEEFDVTKWIQNTQMNENARTVSIPAHVGCITEIDIVNDFIVTSSRDCTLKVFEKHDSLMVKSVMIGHEKEINDFCCIEQNKIASVSMDSTIRVWAIESGEAIKTIKLKEIPYRIRKISHDVVVYLSRGSAYPLVVFNITTKTVVKRFRGMFSDLLTLELSEDKNLAYVSAFDSVYVISLETYELVENITNSSNIYIRNICVCSNDSIICESGMGISVLFPDHKEWHHVNIIDETTSLFKIPRIRVHGNIAYVLWIYGSQHRTSNLTLIDLSTFTRIGEHVLSLMSEGYCVDFNVSLPFVYCATNRGNIYWYTINGKEDNMEAQESWEGHTFNDQVTFGNNFTNVCIATCETGVVVCNHRELRFWNVATDTVLEKIIECTAIGCVYFNNEFVVMDSSRLFFYDTNFLLIHHQELNINMEKIIVANDKLLILYADPGGRLSQEFTEENTEKNIGVYVRKDNELRRITHIRPVSVLFSTPESIFLSDSKGITICDSDTLEAKQVLDFCKHTKGLAISGCQLESKFYTLHSSNQILVWIQKGNDLIMENHMRVSMSITELRKFNNHILGFSSIGTVFVFDGDLNLKKSIVSHLARTIHGTAYNNDNEVVVSDHRGVLKILAQMFAVRHL